MRPTTEQREVVDREHSCEISTFEVSDQIKRQTGKGFNVDDRGADEIRRSLDQVCDGPSPPIAKIPATDGPEISNHQEPSRG